MNNTEKYGFVHFNWEKITGAVFLSPMILLGVLGNILTLLVFGTRQQRKTSIAIYLSALAAADILVLILPAMEFWLHHVLHIYIRDGSDFMCRFFSYVTSVLPCVSAWILVAVSTERMMGVCAPLKMKVFSKPKHALIVVAAITAAVSAIFIPLLPATFLVQNAGLSMCVIDQSILTVEVLTTLEITFLFALPFLIMLINNSIILLQMAGCSRWNCGKSKNNNTSGNSPQRRKVMKTITRRVIILCAVYMMCNAPLMVLNVIWNAMVDAWLHSDKRLINDLNFIFHILLYLNNSVNFFLYCLIGSSFRNDCIKMKLIFIRKLRALCHIGEYH